VSLQNVTQLILDFIRMNEIYALPLVFVLAFGESLAIVALVLPATVILWGVGAFIGASGIAFWPIFLAAGLGAALGDWLSYWLGLHYHHQIGRMWPLSRYPDLLPRGHAFFAKWGWPGVFLGSFIGPLRAIVPLTAGACEMPAVPFQIANWTSAFIWAGVTLGPGAYGLPWLRALAGP
jgi:membrane protein DedA with SNARE-associated domain